MSCTLLLCTPKTLFIADNAISNYPLTSLILRVVYCLQPNCSHEVTNSWSLAFEISDKNNMNRSHAFMFLSSIVDSRPSISTVGPTSAYRLKSLPVCEDFLAVRRNYKHRIMWPRPRNWKPRLSFGPNMSIATTKLVFCIVLGMKVVIVHSLLTIEVICVTTLSVKCCLQYSSELLTYASVGG